MEEVEGGGGGGRHIYLHPTQPVHYFGLTQSNSISFTLRRDVCSGLDLRIFLLHES